MYKNWCRFVLLLFLPFQAISALGTVPDSALIATDTNLVLVQKTKWMESKYFRQSIIPMSLAASSLSILVFPDLKYQMQEQLNWDKTDNVNLYDDELRYAPMGAVVLLTLTGLKGKHKLLEQVAVGGMAYILADFIVYRTKLATHVARPAPFTEHNSFPSQHASMAFVGATLLHREFGRISPWISVAGYSTAAWVGYARIARNRHFLPDVLMGAAVGTLSTNATYWLYDALRPLLNSKLSLSPNVGPQGAEIQLSYQF